MVCVCFHPTPSDKVIDDNVKVPNVLLLRHVYLDIFFFKIVFYTNSFGGFSLFVFLFFFKEFDKDMIALK